MTGIYYLLIENYCIVVLHVAGPKLKGYSELEYSYVL